MFVLNIFHYTESYFRFLFQNHNTRLWKSCHNLLPRETMCFMPDYLNAVTALYPIKLMKTVRLRVSDTEQLLLDPELNLKVVVLVRDPRGVYASRYVIPPPPSLSMLELGTLVLDNHNPNCLISMSIVGTFN